MRGFFACVTLAVLGAPAVACLNDTEIRSHEREFRSQYRGDGSPLPAPSSTVPVMYPVMIGAGVLLGAGAVGLTVRSVRLRG